MKLPNLLQYSSIKQSGTMLVLLIVLLVLILLYVISTKNHEYWLKRKVIHEPPLPLFGNSLSKLLGHKSLVTITKELCANYPEEKLIGFYRGRTPELIVRDPDILRQIMSADFNSFYSRGLQRNSKIEPVYASLFHENGDSWKILRQRLTPAFTTAKLKAMFPLVIECAERLQNLVALNSELDARELMARFTTDFIGACGFGIEMNTINNERSQFRKLGRLIFSRPLSTVFIVAITELFPILTNYIRIDDKMIELIIVDVLKKIRAQRNYKPVGRNDFIDLLLELEAKGKISVESIEKTNPDGSPVKVEMEMTLLSMAAQMFIFFGAGFETSSSATSFTLHELAYNPDVQDKVQADIDRVMAKYGDKLCYEAIAEMTYLDMAFKEGLRKFPSLGVLNRVCTRPCKLKGTDITLDPGVKILIPVQVIHMDEKYYGDPEEFRPERFSAEEVLKRPNFCYLPFGYGPRACVGAKLGQMQSLAGLAAILHRFTVTPAPTSKRELTINQAMNVVQALQGGLPLIFTPRKKQQ